ncbi:MAG: COX15/CtaA family protein [Microthrixaceae bacterium]
MPLATEPPDPTAERWTLSPSTYRNVVVAALVLIAAIVVTGAAVRLTGSGMGCETWPRCTDEELLRFGNPNQAIEQANRLVTGLVSVSVAAAVLGSLRRRPFRRDLVWWSIGLVVGVVGQIVLGGITVLVHLHPAAVAGHFVLSMLLLIDVVVLLWRASHDDGPRRPRVAPAELALSRVAVAAAAALMVTGPVVTGSGPHAGDAEAERFGFFIPDVVRVHSINMWVFLGVVVVLLALLARRHAPADIVRRGYRLLVAIVAQGGIGYLQYELGIPPWLVILHIVGATTVVALMTWFHLGLSGPVAASQASIPQDLDAPSDDRVTAR